MALPKLWSYFVLLNLFFKNYFLFLVYTPNKLQLLWKCIDVFLAIFALYNTEFE